MNRSAVRMIDYDFNNKPIEKSHEDWCKMIVDGVFLNENPWKYSEISHKRSAVRSKKNKWAY